MLATTRRRGGAGAGGGGSKRHHSTAQPPCGPKVAYKRNPGKFLVQKAELKSIATSKRAQFHHNCQYHFPRGMWGKAGMGLTMTGPPWSLQKLIADVHCNEECRLLKMKRGADCILGPPVVYRAATEMDVVAVVLQADKGR
eukprot:CAMPEP_0174287400 /NCGR_PEP_ID=MMETSP0809-20121228/15952_1 /TAXON_ID=73025 ORGANISM="Eutreptiella gymnastica-like, Strain CCMP1594" /NCGR_SAMPLE_ID=MMETSP0809 /ASSEMBLY_ACC=CAM_ASM_000658 /LENGTH=140 /DNA_ID=CAMNT_0015383957 /DNA_START=252 /DNA_END=673 /DNA_ORIENTATION=+